MNAYKGVLKAFEAAYKNDKFTKGMNLTKLLNSGVSNVDVPDDNHRGRVNQTMTASATNAQLHTALNKYDFDEWKHGAVAVVVSCRPTYGGGSDIFDPKGPMLHALNGSNVKSLMPTHVAAEKVLFYSEKSTEDKLQTALQISNLVGSATTADERDAKILLDLLLA